MMNLGVSEVSACASRCRWVAVRTCERVEQDSGGLDDVVVRDGQLDIIVAEVEVELALAEELVGLPAVDVVVDRRPGKPLGHLVEPAIGDLFPHPASVAAVLGNDEMPVDLEHRLLPRGQRRRELDLHLRAVDHVRRVRALHQLAAGGHDLDPGDLVPAVERIGKQEAAGLRGQLLGKCGRVLDGAADGRIVDVLVQLEPEVVEPIGGIVMVGDSLGSGDGVTGGVERGLDCVVHPLLPVLGTRLPRRIAVLVGCDPLLQRPEVRLVGLGIRLGVEPLLGTGRGGQSGQGRQGEQRDEPEH